MSAKFITLAGVPIVLSPTLITLAGVPIVLSPTLITLASLPIVLSAEVLVIAVPAAFLIIAELRHSYRALRYG